MVAPLHMVALVLAIAGVVKIAAPSATRRALVGLGVRVPSIVVRGIGIGEVLVGVFVIAIGSRAGAAALGLIHGGFVMVTVLSMRRGATGCGCFGGERDVAPGSIHLAVNLASMALAGAAVVWPVAGFGDVLATGFAGSLAHLAVVVTGAFLLVSLYTDVAANAAVLAEVRRQRRVAV